MRHPFVRLDSFVVAILLAVAAFPGCSGTTTRGGSESNFQHCSVDTDCTVGVCMGGLCKTQGTGGGAGLLDAGSGEGGAAGHGVAGNHPTFVDAGSGGGRITPLVDAGAGGFAAGGADAGCSAGSLSINATAGGSTGTGGGFQIPPSCPVDADGYASPDDATTCAQYRCPAKVSDLLTGLRCSTPTTPVNSGKITLSSGCGYQWVTIHDVNATYTAVFDTAGTTLVAVEGKGTYPSGPCNSLGYRKGTLPAPCDSGKFYDCVMDSPATGPLAGCRDPVDPGCGICCTPYVAAAACTVTGTDGPNRGYDIFEFRSSDCPCNCPPCATCNSLTEDQLRIMPEHPECQCPAPPPGGFGGAEGTGGSSPGSGGANPCDSYCPYRNQLITQCPGVVPG